MRHSAFTLIELLVAMALLLLFSGLAVSVTLSRMDEAAFREGGDQIAAVVSLARAEAQRRGVVMQVIARGGIAKMELAVEEVGMDAAGEEAAAARPAMADSTGTAAARYEDAMPLPRGVWVSAQSGAAVDPVGAPAIGGTGEEAAKTTEAAAGEAGAVTLAVLLPDGQAVGGDAARYVRGGGGRAGEISINRWTGAVRVIPIAAEAAAGKE